MRISEAAEQAGTSASALRYYEKVGLTRAPRTDAGYRVYDQATQDRLAFVLTVKRLGLPLPRIRELLAVWDAQPCRTVQARLRDLIDEQLEETRRRMTELRALERQLLDGRARLDGLPARNRACDPACPFQQHPAA